MKPAPFALVLPDTMAALGGLLAEPGDSRVMAGGQSLGPMLNLRIARPARLVGLARLPELAGWHEDEGHLVVGACVTHAAIADRRIPCRHHPMLPAIAEGIAYRAVRNRGTIGGSLCHADPAADWLCTLLALGASVLLWNGAGGRSMELRDFVAGAFATALRPGEILRAIRIPRPSPAARWGYFKACRKPGEFAHAMAAVLDDPDAGVRRLAVGALGGAPLVLEGEAALPEAAPAGLARAGTGLDAIDLHLQRVAIRRAWAEAVP